MSFKKIYFLILIFSLGYFRNYGQRINYSNLFPYNSFDIVLKVAGKVGNNIHIWKFHGFSITNSKEKTPISILIFNDQMELIVETPLKMMDETIFGIDEYFQVEGNIYYAYIKYFTKDRVVKRQVSKIDEKGNLISVAPYITAPEKSMSFYVSQKYPYARVDNTVYFATTNSIIPDSSFAEQPELAKNKDLSIKSVFIYKRDLTFKKPLLQAEYTSPTFNFSNPLVKLGKDNTIWVFASNRPDPEKKHIDPSMPYSLFLVRLDSNLHEISDSTKFLKLNSPDLANDIFYRIENAFVIDKNLFLLSFGNRLTTFYSNNTSILKNVPGQGNLPPVREGYESYEIKSLRILQIDESKKSLMDTIISTDLFKAKLLTGNSFYSINDNGIDLFYQQEFPHKFNGILHISVGKNVIKQNDIPVNPNYNYTLSNATKIDETTYIIPFMHHGKIGFMKCSSISR